MRFLLTFLFALCLPVLAQTDPDARLESLLREAQRAQAGSDYRAAADAYREAVAIRPELPELWSNLGLMQYECHEHPHAEEAFRRALAINKFLFVPNLFLGLDLLELKRPRDALAYLLTAEKLKPQDTQALLALGRAFHGLFDPAEAREWYQRAADLAPRNSDAWFGLGIAYFDLAAEHLEQQPTHSAVSDSAARKYLQLGVDALTRAGELDPESPRIHALLGDAYQSRKMFREAETEYSEMLRLTPDNTAGLAGLAGAYLHDGQLDQAHATAAKALARDPADSEINLLMGEILVARHEYAEAEPYLEKSLHVRPDLLPRLHALRGRVLAHNGRSKEAINELTQGLSSDGDGSVYYQLARLYQSSGDTKAAAAAFEKSQQIRAKRDLLAQETFKK